MLVCVWRLGQCVANTEQRKRGEHEAEQATHRGLPNRATGRKRKRCQRASCRHRLSTPSGGNFVGSLTWTRSRALRIWKLWAESWRAFAQACVPWPLTDSSLSVPTLAMGFTEDGIVPAEQVRRPARQLGADLQIHEGFSHALTVEPNWERVAHDMVAWIGRVPGTGCIRARRGGASDRQLAAHRPLSSS